MAYTVIFEQEADGGYSVSVPALPGCHSQGDTKEEALANIREAVALYLESLREHSDALKRKERFERDPKKQKPQPA